MNKSIPITLRSVLSRPVTGMLVISIEKWWNGLGMNDKKTLLGMFREPAMYVLTPYKSLQKNIQQELRRYYSNKVRFLGLEGYIKIE